jgi:hypothetical protein
MVQRTVDFYFAQWNVNARNGIIRLFEAADGNSSIADEQVGEFAVADPEEFQLIVDLLRNEKPVAFEDAALQLRVGHQAFAKEPVGAGEDED